MLTSFVEFFEKKFVSFDTGQDPREKALEQGEKLNVVGGPAQCTVTVITLSSKSDNYYPSDSLGQNLPLIKKLLTTSDFMAQMELPKD